MIKLAVTLMSYDRPLQKPNIKMVQIRLKFKARSVRGANLGIRTAQTKHSKIGTVEEMKN